MTQQDTQPPVETLAEMDLIAGDGKLIARLRSYAGTCTGSEPRRILTDAADRLAALTRRAGGDAIPAGWQLVPVEPDAAMLSSYAIGSPWGDLRRVWRAMLAAAPKPPAGGDAGEGERLANALRSVREYVERKSRDAFDDREDRLLAVIDAALALPAPVVEGDWQKIVQDMLDGVSGARHRARAALSEGRSHG